MSWAGNRRIIITSLLIAGAVLVVAGVLVTTVHQPPSCMDGKRNQGEDGIDCGGSCAYLCRASVAEPSITFVRAVSAGPRTDVIAHITNPNLSAAAKDVAFTVELFNEDRLLIASKKGTLELPPGASVPVYVPNVYSGSDKVGNAFITFDDASFAWYRYEDDTRIIAEVEGTDIELTDTPRVTATLVNPSVFPLVRTRVVVTLFDVENRAIAASQTIIPVIGPQGTATAVFTWNEPFIAEPARIDVRPVVPLP